MVVTRKTPLELLIERYGTYGQAKFYLSTRGQDIAAQEDIHRRLVAGLSAVMASLPSDQRFVQSTARCARRPSMTRTYDWW